MLLDNSRSTARLRFHVPAHADVVLGAGEARTLRLHLLVAERLTVYADDPDHRRRPDPGRWRRPGSHRVRAVAAIIGPSVVLRVAGLGLLAAARRRPRIH